MTSKSLFFLISLLPALFALSTRNSSDGFIKTNNTFYIPVLSDVFRVVSLNQRCFSRGFFECLRLKLSRAIDMAITTDVVEVTSGVYFVKNANASAYNESAVEDARASVGSLLMAKMREFLRTHLLQVKRNRRYYHL